MNPDSAGAGGAASAAVGAPLAILAGEGGLPVQVAAAATAAGRKVVVVALEGAFDERLRTFDLRVIKWGQLGAIEAVAREYGVTELVLVGTIHKRPDFHSIRLDLGTIRMLPRLLKGLMGGDDNALSAVARIIEDHGIRVVGPHEIAPDLVAERGHVAGPRMPPALATDVALAMKAAKAIGTLDIGQAAIAVNNRFAAVEAAEGTDAMIDRVGALHAAGRVKWRDRGGVLVKCAKPQQDLRLDMPAIGPRTVEAVARAELAGIALEAGRVMIVEREETVAVAERTGTFIVAVDGP